MLIDWLRRQESRGGFSCLFTKLNDCSRALLAVTTLLIMDYHVTHINHSSDYLNPWFEI